MKYARWILQQMWTMKKSVLFAFLLIALSLVADFIVVFAQKYIIDDVIGKQEYARLGLVVILFVLAILVARFLYMAADFILNFNIAKFDDLLTRQMYNYIHRIPISEYRNERIAKYVTNMTNDVREAGLMIAFHIPKGLGQMLNTLLLIGIVGYVNPILLLVIMTLSLIYIVLGKKFNPLAMQATKQVAEKRTQLLVHIEEGISSTREVIAFNRMKWEQTYFHHLFGEYFQKVMEEGKLANKTMLASEPLRWVTNLAVLGYGGYAVINGNLSIGMFVVLYQFASQLMSNLNNMYQFGIRLCKSSAYIERIKSLLDGPRISEGHVPLEGAIRSIVLDQITFRYSEEHAPVLDHFSMDIPLGKKIAIVGTSGGGKSTIAQLLMRFIQPSNGEIKINGIPLNDIKQQDWSRKMSIVFQEPYLFSDTIKTNLLLGRRDRTDSEMHRACETACIHDFIMSMPDGYETVIGERGLTLSGGQRQRVALARALLSESDILILDEATSALDMETERRVQHHLDTTQRGRTTVIIAHRLSTIQNADLIYVLNKGVIVEQGTHHELMEFRGEYYKLVSSQDFAAADVG